jgi:regulator of RNase E activity RraA
VSIDCIVHPRGPELPEFAARFAALPTAAISDSEDRVWGAPGVMAIPPTSPLPLYGPAFTVRTRAGDNLAVHKALDLARPGDVLVIDAGGFSERAILGGLIVRYARKRGLAGIVVDGAVRDVGDIESLGLPVYARAVTHVGPYKDGPGEIGGSVCIGGTVVRSGDVVVADRDGLVFVPRERLETVLRLAEALVENEKRIVDAIERGAWDRSWIDQKLRTIPAPTDNAKPEEDARGALTR